MDRKKEETKNAELDISDLEKDNSTEEKEDDKKKKDQIEIDPFLIARF